MATMQEIIQKYNLENIGGNDNFVNDKFDAREWSAPVIQEPQVLKEYLDASGIVGSTIKEIAVVHQNYHVYNRNFFYLENGRSNNFYIEDILDPVIIITDIGNNKESYIYCFDENLTDAVPNMVKMYNKLQNYEDYRFEASYDGKIAFTAKNLNKSLIQITISYSEGDIKADLCGRLSREECLTMFENLFDDILNNKDFPHQFPCFWDNNEEKYEKFSDVADKIFEELVAKKYCDNDLDICDIIDNVMCRELVSITPEGIEYYQKYKMMLETRTLPEGWAKRSDLDPIGDSIVNYIKQHTK